MNRRVLVVSPHFPPVNAPDHQRVRMALPYFAEFGWEPHVLAVAAEDVGGKRDDDLLATVPDGVPVTRVGAWPLWLTRRVGCGSLALRAFGSIARAGAQLLGETPFDLVYFSTTMFQVMTLGPRWKRRFGVPYVLDMQDPWVSTYYRDSGVRPPGGWLKYAFAQWLAGRNEPPAMRGAGHVVSVSPGYPTALRGRYPDVPEDRFSVLPFGASEKDFAAVERRGIRQSVFDPADGLIHWTYLGRGGADLALALRGLFLSLRSLRETNPKVARLRLHFVGTSYASADRAVPTVEPIARELGVGDLVQEQTSRIPYLEGLSLLRQSDAVLVLGSDDPAYSASKVYPCILSRRPIVAVLHEKNLAGHVLQRCQAGTVVPFASGDQPETLADRLRSALTETLGWPRDREPATDWEQFRPYTAREMTRQQCAVFDRVLAEKGGAR